MQIADRQQDTCGFGSVVVDLFEASGERLCLLIGWQLGQQQRVAYADFIGIEGLDSSGYEVSEFQPRRPRTKAIFADVRRDLLDAVLGFVQGQQRAESLRLFHRVDFRPDKVLDQLSL